MRHSGAVRIAAWAALWCYFCPGVQFQAPVPPQDVAASPPSGEILVPAGTHLGLELQDSLNSKFTQKGERVGFKVSPDVLVGGSVAIARESTVDAVVSVARRAGPARRRGELRLEFEKIVLTDGISFPLAARITRVGRWNRSMIAPTEPGNRDALQDLFGLAQMAGLGAALGSIAGSGTAAAVGAGAGAAIGIAAILMERGPEVDLPPGIMFQIELTKPLTVPAPRGSGTQAAASVPAPPAPPSETATPVAPGATPAPSIPNPPAGETTPLKAGIPPPDTAGAAVNPEAPLPPATAQPADLSVAVSEQGVTFKTDVNLVMVETTVRDARGAIYIKLKREDFQILEDGVEQEIRHFSRDELPLSVALVIDRSGSVAPILQQLQRAGYQTLSQLKAGDEVALFAFDVRCERLEDFTGDRQVIADRIATIQAGGGTNITDTLLDVVRYLDHGAPARRHAIILVSDNQQTVEPRANETEVIRTALETETVVYSVRVANRPTTGLLGFPVPLARGGPVKNITQETGGEIFNTRELGSVESAMQAVISRLKLRFTLGYHRKDTRQDGALRRIEVRLTKTDPLAGQFTVYHRQGYYASKAGRALFSPPSPETLTAVRRGQPSFGRPISAAEQEKGPGKPLTNDDVLMLVQAGFGEDTISEAIRTNACRFDTSADALLKLKNGGVSERIIMAMLAEGRVSRRTPMSGGESITFPERVGLYYLIDGAYVPLAIEPVDWQSSLWSPVSTIGGVTKTTLRAKMQGRSSQLQLSGNPEFLLVCPEGVRETDYHLLRAEEDTKVREFYVGFRVLDDGSHVALGGMGKKRVSFSSERAAAGKFRLKAPDLGKGEFAFLPPTKGLRDTLHTWLYTFGLY